MSVVQAAHAMLGSMALGFDGTSTRAALLALVGRVTWGATPEEVSACQAMGPTNYIEYHLDHLSIDDFALNTMLADQVYNLLYYSPDALVGQSPTNASNTVIRAMILRGIFSKRQLFERMVEFWNDHFNIWTFDADPVGLLRIPDDRDVIRANALTNFGTILRASAHSPAMLAYLNNDVNTSLAPNENYARELMELHTLGVDGGYTQDDVINVARCFTGWTYYASGSGTDSYRFRFRSDRHAAGDKVVLGQTIVGQTGAAGQQEGEQVLDILINHPSTAKFIAKKLLRRFWGYQPPQAYIDAVAAAHSSSGGDIKAMLRVVLGLVASQVPPPKLKRPLHLLISSIRAAQATVTSHTSFPGSVQTPMVQAGHLPFNWQAPDGYPDSVDYWAGGQLPRWNVGAVLMNGSSGSGYSGLSVNHVPLINGATTPSGIAEQISRTMLNGLMSPADKAAVAGYLGPTNPSVTKIREGIGLALASPSFQWF